MVDKELREAYQSFLEIFSVQYQEIMKNDLVVSFSWSIDSMQVSEIGGRLIEQYLCDQLIANNSNSLFFELQRRQAMGDIKCTYEYKDKKYEFYIDIKGKFLDQSTFTDQYYKKHNIAINKRAESRGWVNTYKSRSKPNIGSVEKFKNFYDGTEYEQSDFIVLNVKYGCTQDSSTLTFKINEFLDDTSIFLFRDINEQVLYTANIGKGQLQIGDKKYIGTYIIERTKSEFINLINQKLVQPKKSRKIKA